MKRGFTLIEVLIVLVIMAVLVGSAVLSVGSGMKSANLRNASRAAIQCVRHARAVALLKNRPVVVTFEELNGDDGTFSKSRLSINFSQDSSAKGLVSGTAETIWGDTVQINAPEPEDDALALDPMEFEGVHVRLDFKEEEERASISVFSNAEYLKRQAAKTRIDALNKREIDNMLGNSDKSADKKKDGEENDGVKTADSENVSDVVYETNGRCRPYKISVWKEGSDEEDGLHINVDRFGKITMEDDKK